MLKYGIRPHKIERIFISHLHPDHYLGLLGFLTTLNLQRKVAPLHIYGPQGLWEIIEVQLKNSEITLEYELHFHATNHAAKEVLFSDTHVEISSIPVKHRIACCGFLIKERQPYRKFKKELLNKIIIPVEAFVFLKEGKDYTAPDGRIFKADDYTSKENPERTYLYITDTLFLPKLARQFSGIDLLYHESTFKHDLADKATITFHSTALQAAEFANLCGAKKLLLGHYSSRYKDLQILLDEARETFENTFLAREGEVFGV